MHAQGNIFASYWLQPDTKIHNFTLEIKKILEFFEDLFICLQYRSGA